MNETVEIIQNMRSILVIVTDLIKSVKNIEERLAELEKRRANYGNDQGYGR